MNKNLIFLFCASVLLLAGCGDNVQNSSGNEYLARQGDKQSAMDSEDFRKALKDAANVEPTLSFPAKLGVARIDSGALVAIPEAEMAVWSELNSKITAVGQLIPVNSMLPDMMGYKATDAIQKIRLASARQHLDAVLIYEVTDKKTRETNALAIADLTIVGMFVLPARDLKSDAIAAATLIDVMNAYPYGQASNSASASSLSTFANANENSAELSSATKLAAVKNLQKDVENMLQKLYQKRTGK